MTKRSETLSSKIVHTETFHDRQITIVRETEQTWSGVERVRWIGNVDGQCEFSGLAKDKATKRYAIFHCQLFVIDQETRAPKILS